MTGKDSLPSTPDQDVSPKFIEENKKISGGHHLVKVRQKNAPYTRSQRRKRRSEVYRLHFEKGLPAIRIAEMMHVDRNTINSDLKILYERAAREWRDLALADYVYRQFTRLETQRDRLSAYLANTEDIEKQLAIERLIADIDFKLTAAMSKLQLGIEAFREQLIVEINKAAEEKKLPQRYTTFNELRAITIESRKNLDEIREKVKRWPMT